MRFAREDIKCDYKHMHETPNRYVYGRSTVHSVSVRALSSSSYGTLSSGMLCALQVNERTLDTMACYTYNVNRHRVKALCTAVTTAKRQQRNGKCHSIVCWRLCEPIHGGWKQKIDLRQYVLYVLVYAVRVHANR